MLDDYDNNAEDDNRMSRDPYGGGGGGSGRNHPPRPTSGGHRSFERPRAWPPSPSFGYVDLQIGNHLRTVHPSPMSTDQVVAVPGMFGSELNVTSFWEIRDELEPLLRVKYSHIATNSHGNTPREDGDGGVWRLDMVRGCVILVAPQFQAQPTAFGGGEEQEEEEGGDGHPGSRRTLSTLVVAPSHVRDSSNSGGGGGGGRDAESQAAAGAVPAVARAFLRICEYLSIHPGSAVVNAGITLGRPTAKLRPAHSAKHHSNNCFVIAAFGAPRKVVLHRRDNNASVLVPLENNGIVAIMGDASRVNGWLYGIETNAGDDHGGQHHAVGRLDSKDGAGNMPKSNREETITLFVSGHCTKVRSRRPAAAAVARPWQARPPPPPPTIAITPLHRPGPRGDGDRGLDDDHDDPDQGYYRPSPVQPRLLLTSTDRSWRHGGRLRSRSRSRSRSSSPSDRTQSRDATAPP